MKKRITSVPAHIPSLDLSGIMGLEGDVFIRQLYILALGRVPDVDGMKNAKNALAAGLPKEALAYFLCTSKEFASRAQVSNINEYRKVYRKYNLYNNIKHFPVIKQIWAFISIPHRIEILDSRSRDTVSALETANQKIVYANIKIDDLAVSIKEKFNPSPPIISGFPGGVIAVHTKDYIFGVPSEEWRLATYLNSGGTFEPGTEKLFRSIIKEGMIVLDIGANLGIYTLHALAAGCVVYSYEPTPRIYEILLDNIGINGFEPTGRANTYNLGVSDNEDEVDFNIYNTSGHNSMFGKGEGEEIIKIKTVSLDNHLSYLDRVDVVKIDVEGAECLVLQGMKKTIANNPEIKMIMEFAPSNLKCADVDPLYLIKKIRSMELHIQVIDEETGEIDDISDEELCKVYSVNLLLQKLI